MSDVFGTRLSLRNRAAQFFIHSTQQRDWLGLALLGALVAVAVAAVSILFSQTMKEAALKRFQLASDSFPLWAVHQTVPAMYNFENRIKFSNVIDDQGNFDTSEESYIEDAVNHFPARFITFGDKRYMFSNGREGMFEMQSVFGETSLVSRWTVTRDQPEQLTVHRVEQRLDRKFNRGLNRQSERGSGKIDRAGEMRGRDE